MVSGRRRQERKEEREKNIPALDKVLEIVAPKDVSVGLVLELGRGVLDDVGQQVQRSGAGLHLGAVGREGEAMLGNLEQGDAGRPDVGRDSVRLPRDALRGHVVAGADEGAGVSLGAELAGHAEVAELHIAVAAKENVARLDIAVDDLLGVEVRQAMEHALGNLPQDLLASSTAEPLDLSVNAVQRPTLAELHGDGDGGGRRVDKGAVIAADVLRGASLVEAQLADDLPRGIRIGVCCDDLDIVSVGPAKRCGWRRVPLGRRRCCDPSACTWSRHRRHPRPGSRTR